MGLRCVAKVVMYWDSSASSNWLRSDLLKTLAPNRIVFCSFSVGVGCHFLLIALFAALKSMQILILFWSFFGTTTIGDTHGVGPPAFSITPSFSSLCINSSVSFLT